MWIDRLDGSLTGYAVAFGYTVVRFYGCFRLYGYTVACGYTVMRLCGYTVVKVKVISEKPYDRITSLPYNHIDVPMDIILFSAAMS